jgi:chemotaxis signal transduction protein/HPt (histidine-containing phosphotransfer) domain-containing protein
VKQHTRRDVIVGEFDDLIEEFVTESREHITDIEEDLIKIETEREHVDPEVINRVFRSAHSIKGSAKFLDLINIGELAHKMEDVLNLIRSSKLIPTSDVTSPLLHGADMLKTMFEDVTSSNEMDISEQLSQLQLILEGSLSPTPAKAAPADAKTKADSAELMEISEGVLRQHLERGQVYLVKTEPKGGLEAFTHELAILGEILGSVKQKDGKTAILFATIMEPDVIPIALQIEKQDITEVTMDMVPVLTGKTPESRRRPEKKPETFVKRPSEKEHKIMEEEIRSEATEMEERKNEVIIEEEERLRENYSYITFALDNEIYAVSIYMVEEIIGLQDISLLPNVPNFIKGVINLRGEIVPIMDLRLKFGLELKEYNLLTVFLIVKIKDRVLGMVVDKVSDVLVIDPAQIQQTPAFFAKISTDFIEGVYKDPQGQLVILINIASLVKPDEWGLRKTSPVEASA